MKAKTCNFRGRKLLYFKCFIWPFLCARIYRNYSGTTKCEKYKHANKKLFNFNPLLLKFVMAWWSLIFFFRMVSIDLYTVVTINIDLAMNILLFRKCKFNLLICNFNCFRKKSNFHFKYTYLLFEKVILHNC